MQHCVFPYSTKRQPQNTVILSHRFAIVFALPLPLTAFWGASQSREASILAMWVSLLDVVPREAVGQHTFGTPSSHLPDTKSARGCNLNTMDVATAPRLRKWKRMTTMQIVNL
eukprot:2375845-Amphidinium_carterae.1